MTQLKRHSCIGHNRYIWKLGKKIHHPSEPAIVEHISDTRTSFEWYRYNNRHRVDGPAYQIVEYDLENNAWKSINEMWFFKGWLHSDSGPAVKTDHITEYWYMGTELNELQWMVYAQGLDQFPIEKIGADQPARNQHPIETMYG